MLGHDRAQSVQHRHRHRRAMAFSQSDVYQHQFRGSGQKALGGMIQAVKTVDALAIETEQLGANPHWIMGDQFALIIDMGFHHKRRTLAAIPVILPHAQRVHEGVGGAIKGQDIVGDVHVTVVVHPFGGYDAGIQTQGGFNPHGYNHRESRRKRGTLPAFATGRNCLKRWIERGMPDEWASTDSGGFRFRRRGRDSG